jgi:ribosome-binding protein aMBF1 (putative translation factor)
LSTPNAGPERKEATDKVSLLSLSVSALMDLATANTITSRGRIGGASFLIVRAPMDIRRVVGKNVRRYRIEAELSQEDLAAGMGVEQGYVSRLEAGKRNPTIVEIWHVAEALGVRPAALFRGRAQPSKSTAKQTKTGKPIIQI